MSRELGRERATKTEMLWGRMRIGVGLGIFYVKLKGEQGFEDQRPRHAHSHGPNGRQGLIRRTETQPAIWGSRSPGNAAQKTLPPAFQDALYRTHILLGRLRSGGRVALGKKRKEQ
jgi:hypothetical protein